MSKEGLLKAAQNVGIYTVILTLPISGTIAFLCFMNIIILMIEAAELMCKYIPAL